MNKTRLLVAVLFVVAFAAGLTSGLATRHAQNHRASRGGWLASRLHLTTAQRQQMLKIWSSISRGERHHFYRQRRQFQDQRDQAILKILTPDQRHQYDAILTTYHNHLTALNAQRHARFEQAVTKTKAILTPAQRKLYDQFVAQHRGPGHQHRFDYHHRHPSPKAASPAPRPAGKPAVTAPDKPATDSP